MINLTQAEQNLFERLLIIANAHGTTVRICGGYVRDKLLGLESHDIDLAVDNMSGKAFAELIYQSGLCINISVIEARPEQSKHLETARVRVMIDGHAPGFELDICALRKETYADSRIPNSEPGTPKEDAFRRDLTVNALFYNLNTKQVEDFTGLGLHDLKFKLARTPLEPKQTFLDDPLRILRYIRFCAKYDLEDLPVVTEAACDPEVQQAFVTKISKERIFKEMIGQAEDIGYKPGFLTGPDPGRAMSLVNAMQFVDILFSPIGVKLNPWDTDQNNSYHDLSILYHTLLAVSRADISGLQPEDQAVLITALMCHDLGKRDPACIQVKDDGTYSYLTHDDRSVQLTDIVLDQLSFPIKMKERVLRLVKHHMRYHALEDKPSAKSLRRILRDLDADYELLLRHSCADACGKIFADIILMQARHEAFRTMTLDVLSQQNNQPKIARPINGHELAELGVPKGPAMGNIFKAMDEALLDNPGMTKEEAILFVSNYETKTT